MAILALDVVTAIIFLVLQNLISEPGWHVVMRRRAYKVGIEHLLMVFCQS